ncbi:interferon lambda-3-like [Callospermophilus lateralis]
MKLVQDSGPAGAAGLQEGQRRLCPCCGPAFALQCGLTWALAPQESLLLKDLECPSPLFPRPWDLRQLQVWERPVALQAELALTLRVLGTMANSTLGDVLDQPLHTLGHIQSQLQACALAQPTAGPRPQGRHRHRLSHWLQRLQQAPEKESPACLQASVTFNLLRLLVRDLKCVASGHLCV